MIILRDISLRRGSKVLLRNANATIQPGQHIALIGANGCGKSSLLDMLLGKLGVDAGDVEGLGKLRLAHMAQEVASTTLPAAQFVLQGDAALYQVLEDTRAAEAQGDYDRAARLHSRLEELDGYDTSRRVERLLQGLGFSAGDGERSVNDFSGGWRIRLNLARALMTPSDLLLLDEPTNHLDLDATLWLQQWLAAYAGTLLIISHDRDFIDGSCQRILHIERENLHAYSGNYSDFERLRAEHLANQQATWEKQQRRVARIEQFVARFRYKATKARQAQSRLKELQRMELTAPAHLDSPFDFSFLKPQRSSDPLVRLDEAVLGYGDTVVLSGVDLQLRPGSRYGLLGRNGAGKSTLLKTLVGELPLLGGRQLAGDNCRSGYFDQQQLEALDLEASPLLHLQRLRPEAREQDILDFLGGFNFRGEVASSVIAPFSGGEKARLALAMVVWQRPNLLVLDEPTNHLDLEMRHALEVALLGFDGALILVTHDRHLLRNTADELLLVHDGQVEEYRDDLDSYEKWIVSSYREPESNRAPQRDGSRREQRQLAATARQRLRPLKLAIEQTEKDMSGVEQALQDIEQRLNDSELYGESGKAQLADLLLQQGQLKTRAAALEETWFEQQQALEEATQGG
jgi:ATP-binding cassette subfamily F protein 3